MRRNHGRDSRARFFPEGFPRLHFAGLYIHPRDRNGFQGLPDPPAGNHIYRSAVRRPANDRKVRFDPWYRTKLAPFERPNPPFSIRPAHRDALAIWGDYRAGGAFGSDGLGISTVQVDQIVATSVPHFNSRGQQPLAIRQKTNNAVANGIVGELPRFARSRRHQTQLSSLRRFRDHPFSIGRDGHGVSLANPRRRRPIGIAQKDGVVRSATLAFLVEHDLPAVGADIAQFRPSEPPQFMLFFSTRRHAPDP